MHAHTLYVIARYLTALMFLMSAAGKLGSRKESLGLMQSHHIPLASVGLFGSVIVEIIGVICLVFGIYLVPMTWILLLFIVIVTLVMPVQDIVTNQGRPQALQLLGSNLAIIGGLLAIIACALAGV